MKAPIGESRVHSAEPSPRMGYYGVPVIHGPHWKWLIIAYFYFGGIAGSSAAISGFARFYGGPSYRQVARIGNYVALAALIPCPVFLILDLGRPARFLNMMRAFRPSSPMSMGTWGLTAFSFFAMLSAGLQAMIDFAASRGDHPMRRTPFQPRPLSLFTAVAGLFVAGYTGVVLAATAVPIWSKRPALLGPLFFSSAMSSGAAAIAAAAAAFDPLNEDAEDGLRQVEAFAASVEGALMLAWTVSLGTTAKPLNSGLMGYVVRHGAVGVGVTLPLVISAAAHRLPVRARRVASFVSAALTLFGVFALRYAVVEAGRHSADDPMATFEMAG
jgi:formate-dependent nitrite reductase membrane component NrfD